MIYKMDIVNESAWVESDNGKLDIKSLFVNIITPYSEDMNDEDKKESSKILIDLLKKQYRLDRKDPIIEKELKNACIKYWHENDRKLNHYSLRLDDFNFTKIEIIPSINGLMLNNAPLLVGYSSTIKREIAQRCAHGQLKARDEIYKALSVSFVWDPFAEKPEVLQNPYRLKVIDNPYGNSILDKMIDVMNEYVDIAKKKK